MRIRTLLTLPLSIGLLASASVAAPAPTVTITQPTPGQVISRSSGSFTIAGTTGFVAPTKTDTPLYLRYEASGGSSCGNRYLSATNGTDAGNSCQSQAAIATLAGSSFSRDWIADERAKLPVTVDASRNLTGTFTVRTSVVGAGGAGNWIQMDVAVTINSTTVTQSFDSGFYQGPTATFQLNMDLPEALDKVDADQVQVVVTWRRVIHAPSGYHTYLELDNPPSFISIPSYSASFARKVQVTVDDPAFAFAQDAQLGENSFSTVYPTSGLASGTHTVYARAIQGAGVSLTRTVSFSITT